jgi:predicted RNA-binding protein
LGTFEYDIQNLIKKHPNHLIINTPLNKIPFYTYMGWNFELNSIQQYENNLLNFLPPKIIVEWSQKAKEQGILRDLVEMISCSDNKLADLLYQFDFRGWTKDNLPPTNYIYQNSWQSYGREYIRNFNKRVHKFSELKENALLLPCTKTRPYYSTKKRSYNSQNGSFEKYYKDPSYHKIVMTNIGLVPEEFWNEELVLKYTAGVPDIWRVQKIAEHYFKIHKFEKIVSFVEFAPYIEILEIQKMRFNLNIDFEVGKKYKMIGAKFATNNL